MNEECGGIIRVSRPLLDELFGDILKTADVDTQGTLKARGVFDEIRKRLQLPETYIIHGIYWRWDRRYWEVVVEGPDLPLLQEGVELPVLSPIYKKHAEDGRVELLGIKVEEDQFAWRAQMV